MNDDIDKKPIARIYDSVSALAKNSESQAPKPSEIKGMGFLITERHVLTCAHVIEGALGVSEGSPLEAPETLVKLDFPFSASADASDDTDCFQRFGRVIYWRPTKAGGREADIAVLRLDEPLPISPVKFSQASDTQWRAFGCPIVGSYWSGGTFRQANERGWRQMNISANDDAKVDKGFSGTAVWHGSESTVTGMVVARTSGIGYQPAFMLPTELLQSAIHEADADILFDSLASDFDISTAIIRRVYRQCLPDMWEGSDPKDLRDMLVILGKDISDIPGPKGEVYSALSVFVAELVAEQSLSVAIRAILERWLRLKVKDVSALLLFVEQRQLARIDQTNKASLLFQLSLSQRDDLILYRVEAWLVPNPKQYDAKRTQGYEPLTVDDNAERTFSLNEIPGLLEKCLNQAVEGYQVIDPTVEIFLPLDRLNDAVDVWEIGLEDDEDDPLGGLEPLKIGWRYRVVLRSSDRVRWRYQQKKALNMANWHKKWEQVDTTINQGSRRACDLLFDGSDAEDQRPLTQCLAPLTAFGVKFSHVPSVSAKKEIATTLGMSIPVAVWLRHPIPDAPTKLDAFLSVCLHQMIESAKERRSKDCDPDDLGCHLALLWDNPNLLPPFERHAS